jgi:branched-chain amino acid transport system permease protein
MRLATLLLALLALAGCARIDADQARICRIALPALYPPGMPIEIVGVEPGGAPNAIVIRHEVRRPPNPPRERVAECRFSGGALSKDRLELSEIKLDGRPMPGATLHLLRRYWIDDPGTAALQPPPSPGELAAVPRLPRNVAIAVQHAVLALPQIALYALLAPAYALIYGLIGRINLAFGELAIIGGQGALVGAIAGGMWSGGEPAAMLAGAALLALAASATHADAMARRVLSPLAGSGGQPLLVATAALSVAMMEYVRLAQSDGARWTPPLLGAPILLADGGAFPVTVTRGALVFAALAFAAGALLLAHMRWSRFGREWRASAEEPVAAALLGVDTRKVLVRSMTIAGLLAGLAGFIVTANYGGIGFSGGLAIGLKALIAAVIGGIGSVGGAMAGAVILGALEAGWAALLPIHLREAFIFALLVVLLTLKPGGFFGYAGRDPSRDSGLR